MLNFNDVIKVIENHVDDYVNQTTFLPQSIVSSPEKLQHVKDISASIMQTKWKLGYNSGSFVQAVVANNLKESFNWADSVCKEALHFFVVMVCNLDMPIEVWNYIKENNLVKS